MERFVDFNKGDFIGREALLEQREKGLTHRLTGMTVETEDTDAHGFEPVLAADEIVGYVASGGYGHRTGQSIAFSYLPVQYAEPGTSLRINLLGKKCRAVVTEGPLYDPENKRLTG